MVGRPRKRATEAAIQPGAELPTAPIYLDAADAPSPDLLAQVSGTSSDGGVAFNDNARQATLAGYVAANDRQMLARWWRDQAQVIERAGVERSELLAAAGVEHPCQIFAQQAKLFGAVGMPRDVAAVLLQMPEAEFVMYYGIEYTIGSAEVFMQVSQNFMRIALSSNDRVAVKAATEFLNRRGGEEWRAPAQKLEIDDGRKSRDNVIDSSKLTWEERQALKALMLRARTTVDAEVGPVGLIGARVESDGDAEVA